MTLNPTCTLRITPEALDALAAAALMGGVPLLDDSVPDGSGLLVINLPAVLIEFIGLVAPWLDVNNPHELSSWIIDSVYSNLKESN